MISIAAVYTPSPSLSTVCYCLGYYSLRGDRLYVLPVPDLLYPGYSGGVVYGWDKGGTWEGGREMGGLLALLPDQVHWSLIISALLRGGGVGHMW